MSLKEKIFIKQPKNYRKQTQSNTHRKKKKEKSNAKNQTTETQQRNHSKYECSGRQVYILTPPKNVPVGNTAGLMGGGRARVNMLTGQPRHDLTYI